MEVTIDENDAAVPGIKYECKFVYFFGRECGGIKHASINQLLLRCSGGGFFNIHILNTNLTFLLLISFFSDLDHTADVQ